MSVDLIRAELEDERSRRLQEVVVLANAIAASEHDQSRRAMMRAGAMLIYAHYEGFVRFCLCAYARFVNEQSLKCEEAIPNIVAASWNRIFQELENPTRKAKAFKQKLPDEAKLHRFARRAQFVDEVEARRLLRAGLDESVIDTESNLWPIVLQKNYFLMGLNYEPLRQYEADVNELVKRRNAIAHGDMTLDIKVEDFARFRRVAESVMDAIMLDVFNAMRHQAFRRQPVEAESN